MNNMVTKQTLNENSKLDELIYQTTMAIIKRLYPNNDDSIYECKDGPGYIIENIIKHHLEDFFKIGDALTEDECKLLQSILYEQIRNDFDTMESDKPADDDGDGVYVSNKEFTEQIAMLKSIGKKLNICLDD
jgi:hypothetical protein